MDEHSMVGRKLITEFTSDERLVGQIVSVRGMAGKEMAVVVYEDGDEAEFVVADNINILKRLVTEYDKAVGADWPGSQQEAQLAKHVEAWQKSQARGSGSSE